MADFDFFDQYRDKMRSLRPSEQSVGEDWQALSQGLDATMPLATPAVRRYRWATAALLLLLLASNLWWGFTMNQQNEAFGQLASKVDALNAASSKPTTCDEVASLREQLTLLQTRLDEALVQQPRENVVQALPFVPLAPSSYGQNQLTTLAKSVIEKGEDDASAADAAQNADGIASNPTSQQVGETNSDHLQEAPALAGNTLKTLPNLEPSLLKWTTQPPSLGIDFPIIPKPEEKPPVAQQIAVALSPKTFKAGPTAGWLLPLSDKLEHEAGYSTGLRAELGFSRQWSLSAEWNMSTLHYKALTPNAPIGLDSLPLPVGQQFLEGDVMNQRLLYYAVGLRRSFLPKGNWHPYVAGAWSGLVVMPFMVHYETMSETTGNIAKGVFETNSRSAMKNYLRLGAGMEMPLGKRLGLSLEGSYLRQWRGGGAPLLGIRMGLSYLF